MNLAILAILVPGGLKNGILTADRKTKNANCDFKVEIPIFRVSIPRFTLLRAIEIIKNLIFCRLYGLRAIKEWKAFK